MTDKDKSERLQITIAKVNLPSEPPGLLRLTAAVLLLLVGVPMLLGSGYCTFYFVSGTAHMTMADLETVLAIGGSGVAVSGLMIWGGWRLVSRRKARHD